MTVYTQDLSVSQYGIQYHGTTTEVQDLAVGDTITASFDQEASSSQQTSLLDVEDNDIVFTLVNCTISPTNVKNRGTFTITPTSSGAAYSCVGVLVYYSPGGGSYGGPSANHQQTTFTISGFYGVAPVYGLEIFDASGNSRLRYDNRLCKFHSKYSGDTGGSSVYLPVTGMSSNGTWGANNQADTSIVKVSIGTGGMYLSNTDFGSGGNLYGSSTEYEIIVFRI